MTSAPSVIRDRGIDLVRPEAKTAQSLRSLRRLCRNDRRAEGGNERSETGIAIPGASEVKFGVCLLLPTRIESAAFVLTNR